MIRALLEITNPAVAPARPENELSREMTTGMSAPPMGSTARIPMTSAIPPRIQKPTASPEVSVQIAAPTAPRVRTPLTTCWPGNWIGRPGTSSSSLA
jgi:hypothetical protein